VLNFLSFTIPKHLALHMPFRVSSQKNLKV
jgi:hypothetical protein